MGVLKQNEQNDSNRVPLRSQKPEGTQAMKRVPSSRETTALQGIELVRIATIGNADGSFTAIETPLSIDGSAPRWEGRELLIKSWNEYLNSQWRRAIDGPEAEIHWVHWERLKELVDAHVQEMAARERDKAPESITSATKQPPLGPKFLLKTFLGKERRDEQIGDLVEEYQEVLEEYGEGHARFWFWMQTLRSLFPHAGRWIEKIIEKLTSAMASELFRRIGS